MFSLRLKIIFSTHPHVPILNSFLENQSSNINLFQLAHVTVDVLIFKKAVELLFKDTFASLFDTLNRPLRGIFEDSRFPYRSSFS